jgi:hypothetical protein
MLFWWTFSLKTKIWIWNKACFLMMFFCTEDIFNKSLETLARDLCPRLSRKHWNWWIPSHLCCCYKFCIFFRINYPEVKDNTFLFSLQKLKEYVLQSGWSQVHHLSSSQREMLLVFQICCNPFRQPQRIWIMNSWFLCWWKYTTNWGAAERVPGIRTYIVSKFVGLTSSTWQKELVRYLKKKAS